MSPLFFVMLMCSYQSFQGSACNTIAGAYAEGIGLQRSVDEAMKPYIEDIPKPLQETVLSAYTLYTRKVRIGLYRGLTLDIRVDNDIEGLSSNMLAYSRTF